MASTFKNSDKIGQIYLENIDDLVFILNDKFECEHVNFQSSIKKLDDFIYSDDFRGFRKLLNTILKVGHGKKEVRMRPYGGQLKWYEVKGSRFKDDEDNKQKVFLICRDITKFKKIEFEYEDSQDRFGKLTDSLPEIKYWKLLQSKEGVDAVQKTREMLELVIENIPQLIYWKDTNLAYIGCNNNFASINGLKDPSNIIGKKDKDLKWPKTNLNYIKESEKLVILNDKPEYNVIKSLVIANGENAWFEINRIPLHDSGGQVVGILSTYEDITIRREGEKKLQESEKKYRSILENIKEGYFEVDLKGSFTFFNDAFCELVGINRDDLLGLNYQEFVNEENKNKIFKVYNDVYKSGNPDSNFQFQFNISSGETLTFESSIYLSHDSTGNKIGFNGLARNITEKFVLEQKIKESEEKYRTIFNASPDYIFLTDIQGIILDMNPALLNRVGMKLEEVLGMNFSKFYAGEDFSDLVEVGKAILDGKEIKGIEVQAKTTSGESFEYELNSVPLKEEGKISAILNLGRDITLRKETEEKLRESENKYRHLFESSPYSIILINRLGVIIDCNPVTEKIFHREIQDLLGKSFLEVRIKPEKMLPLFKQRYKAILKGDTPNAIEVKISRSQDGSEMWINIDDSLVEIGGEEVFQVIIQDITEKKIAEQKLKKSQEELQVLNRDLEQKVKERAKDLMESEHQHRVTINSLNDPLHVINRDMRIILSNSIFSNWLSELDLDEKILGRNIFEAFPFLSDEVRKEYDHVFNSGEILLTEEESIFLNNKEIFTETRKIPIFRKGKVDQVITIIRDITESKKMKDQIKISEENFRNMITNLDEGYYKIEFEGKILYHNPAFAKIAGYDPSENLINQHQPFIWQNLRDQEKYKEALMKNGFIRNFTIPVIRKDGEIIIVQVNAHLLREENNDQLTIEGTFTEVTEKFRLEQELMDSEKKLREQNIELRKLDKVKNDFITMAAHELKTPLISISGYTDYILMKHRPQLNAEITGDLLTVQRNVSRLEVLMDQLLEVLKIDENELKLQKDLENVSKIINDCLNELSYLINEKNLEIVLNIDREIMLSIDAARIFTVFTNLLSNAIKFTPDYGWIEINARQMGHDHLFEIKDNGIGLTGEDIKRLFKKFERLKPPLLSNNINIKDSGTGLGLYITKGIIAAHGGTIKAHSEGINKGSTFSFTLPA